MRTVLHFSWEPFFLSHENRSTCHENSSTFHMRTVLNSHEKSSRFFMRTICSLSWEPFPFFVMTHKNCFLFFPFRKPIYWQVFLLSRYSYSAFCYRIFFFFLCESFIWESCWPYSWKQYAPTFSNKFFMKINDYINIVTVQFINI